MSAAGLRSHPTNEDIAGAAWMAGARGLEAASASATSLVETVRLAAAGRSTGRIRAPVELLSCEEIPPAIERV